jgi:hypothetical protein
MTIVVGEHGSDMMIKFIDSVPYHPFHVVDVAKYNVQPLELWVAKPSSASTAVTQIGTYIASIENFKK